MNRSTTIKGTFAAALVGLAMLLGGAQARASDYCPPACRYVWVTTYVTREVPYTKVVTLYDHCGRPYKVARTCFETVTVAVRKRVLVCD